MSQSDWDLIYQVHVLGAFKTTQAAWKHFKAQKYGRIVNTASVAGLLGNFGQTNYSTAKSGLVGFSAALAREGLSSNIHTNTIVPLAGSRLTDDVIPPGTAYNILSVYDKFILKRHLKINQLCLEIHAALKPELIAPVVAWLCHEDCPSNGVIVESAAGFAARCTISFNLI